LLFLRYAGGHTAAGITVEVHLAACPGCPVRVMNRLAELLSTEASADLRYESTPLDPEGVDWVPLGVGGPCFEVSYARQHADRFRIQWWGKRTPRRPGR
jgi:hypothetical protein